MVARNVLAEQAAVGIKDWLRGLDASEARVKYGSSKALRLASRQSPASLYPHFNRFASLLAGDNTILRWNATRTLGYLAAADCDGQLEKIFARFFAPIRGHEMIGAANTIAAGADIALAQPRLADRISRELLKVETATYATPECRNVAVGHAIRALGRFFGLLKRRAPVLAFIRRQLNNPRQATRRHAERFLRRAV
jgi:hypothetical protein